MAISFDKDLYNSRGNLLNLYEEKISEKIAESDGLSDYRRELQQRLRAAYLPNGDPGYKPETPINKAETRRFMNHLLELRHHAGTANDDVAIRIPVVVLREFFNFWVSGDFYRVFKLPTTIKKAIMNISDGIAETELSRINMMKEYHNQVVEYIKMNNQIYMNEKRDSASFRVTEMDRAYVSFNRLEHFFGGSNTGLHHDTSFNIAKMEKIWKGEQARVSGAFTRRGAGILGGLGEAVLPTYNATSWLGSLPENLANFPEDFRKFAGWDRSVSEPAKSSETLNLSRTAPIGA